jgi:hypothetical protein
MQTNKGKAREYKVLLGAISIFVGLFSFYFIAFHFILLPKALMAFSGGFSLVFLFPCYIQFLPFYL